MTKACWMLLLIFSASVSRAEVGPYQPIFAEIEKVFRPTLEKNNMKFRIEVVPDDQSDVASAENDGQETKAIVRTKLLNNPRLSADGLRFILCHELGHIYGGAPRRSPPPEWTGPVASDGMSLLSSEGQADYYAAVSCFRKLVAGQNHQDVLQKGGPISEALKAECDRAWGAGSDGSLVCQRTSLGAYNMLQLVKDFEISFETPSTEKVERTYVDMYPSRQCRLDTAVAGALCNQNMNLILDANDLNLSQCAQSPRPSCWYHAN